MKVKRAVAGIVIMVAAASVFISAVAAQRVIRIVGGSSRPSGNSPGTAQPANPDMNAVAPIEPTAEEAAQIEDLIEQLGDPHLVRRDRAMSVLAGFEAKALTQVRGGKSHDDDEIAARCALLEEVIQSRQGELFLASRRLNLTIDELNGYLNNEDVTPLLSILRGRAQPGLVALWARVLARLCARSQLYPTGELCREIEGDVGYGQALTKAARSPEAGPSARNLLILMTLLPPGEPADTIESMTQLRFSMGGGKGLETVLSATSDFRGVYAAEALLAGIDGRPDSNAPEAASEKIAAETTEVRITLALSMIETCTLAQLNAAGLPPVAEMSPILLNTWLALLQRSGLNPQIEGAMLGLLSSGADTRRLSIAAGWYADVSPVTDVIDVFETLPFEAQLGVLDAWWLNPREPKVTHAFLLKLLSSERAGVRNAAARSLGQYRAPSTATALLKAALADDVIAPGALTSLMPMADLLSDTELKALADALPSAGLLTRPLIATILIQSGNAAGLQPLVAGWRKLLPRNELPLAVNVLAMQSLTAPGAYAASLRASALMSNSDPDIFLMQTLENKDLEMIRALLGLSDDDGFRLLIAMATDENDSGRIAAMNALAMGERDSELVGDWLKRLSGEIKDPQSRSIGDAISFSKTPEAEQFRSNLMQQGSGAANLHLVAQSVLLGRSETVTLEKLVDVLFDTPQSAQNWLSLTSLINRPLPPKAMRNIATALAFAQGQNLLSQPGLALMLADSGVDIFEVLYGDTPEPKARDIAQLYNTVVLCDAERAEPVLNNTELKEDGSNYVALAIAKAWLGLLADGQSARLRRGVTGSPTSLFGAVDRVERARLGQTGALRSLLDAFGPDSVRFQRGATAEARLMEQRWGGPQMNTEGVASAAYASSSTPPRLGAEQIRSLFTEAIPEDWRPWWSCRRALLQFDEASGKYTIEVLP